VGRILSIRLCQTEPNRLAFWLVSVFLLVVARPTAISLASTRLKALKRRLSREGSARRPFSTAPPGREPAEGANGKTTGKTTNKKAEKATLAERQHFGYHQYNYYYNYYISLLNSNLTTLERDWLSPTLATASRGPWHDVH